MQGHHLEDQVLLLVENIKCAELFPVLLRDPRFNIFILKGKQTQKNTIPDTPDNRSSIALLYSVFNWLSSISNYKISS